MTTLPATLRLDVRLQARSRLYTIGLSMAVALGLVARGLLSDVEAGRVLGAFYLLGIGSTTYVFGASLVLSERSHGTLQALRATPLTSKVYLGSKILTLSAFALVESAILYAVGFWGVSVSPVPLILGVVSLGVVYTAVGMGQVAAHDSVTSFLMPGALLVGSLLQLPFLYVLGVGPLGAWYFVPTQGPLLLMLAGFESLEPWQWLYAVGMSSAAIAGSWWWARRRFLAFVSLQEG
jgi:fluoroquinolone transport system permease protein